MRELIVLCSAYSISLFYRGMIAVIAPEISADLALDEAMLGVLASSFFLSFAVAQIPTGIALDRFGGRITIAGFMWFAVFGTWLFSVATTYYEALLAQVLIGVGCAPVFVGIMLFIGRRFSPQRFAYVTALVLAVGSLGDLMGTTPLAMLAQWLGWRSSLQLIMLVPALISCLFLFAMESDRPEVSQETLVRMLKGMAKICSIRSLWTVMPMFLASYAVLMAIRGLWSGPYLADIFAASATQRGFILMAMSVSMAVGTFLLGLADRRFQQTKWVVLCTSMLTLLALMLLAYYPARGSGFAMGCFIVIGLFGYNYPLLMSHSRTFLSPQYYGRGMAVLTAISMIGVAIIQSGSGWLMEWATSAKLSSVEQYRMLFVLLAGVLATAMLAYSFSRREGSADQPTIK
ncbi:MFS transporter [Neptunomonas antarctica]|uniref:Predicted arabinose efflux permease, MFS family n=1 Tax=Neptunomonas antarctica TaxID=619304 RepID=A0A1N7M9M2_9GAMM|nr:MFS transporter [Neptunomonas antarctica]SIS82778.1 Predicted arabinose efflux permease, MFS family [Neptunomonas antarctica]